jgi:hypothetical protein
MKLDRNGNVNWVKTYGGNDLDNITDVCEIKGSGYILTGYTESFGKYSTFNNDAYIIRTDLQGDTLWSKTLGGPNHDYFDHVTRTRDGGFIFSGLTRSYVINGDPSLWMLKTDSVVWSCGDMFVGSTVQTLTVAVGSQPIQSEIIPIIYDRIQTVVDHAPCMTVDTCGLLGIHETDYQVMGVTVYPNPSNGDLTITSQQEIDEIRISDLLGKIISVTKPKTVNASVHINSPGIYFVTIACGQNKITKKIIVQE